MEVQIVFIRKVSFREVFLPGSICRKCLGVFLGQGVFVENISDSIPLPGNICRKCFG